VEVAGYRDDRDALALQVRELERENEALRLELDAERERHQRTIDERDGGRQSAARRACVACGGSLHAVAVFSGHDARNPTPLRISTMRFGSPGGGFTASAPYRTLACASCGLIHGFIDFEQGDAAVVGEGVLGDEDPVP
jgi:hypothetical protein